MSVFRLHDKVHKNGQYGLRIHNREVIVGGRGCMRMRGGGRGVRGCIYKQRGGRGACSVEMALV